MSPQGLVKPVYAGVPGRIRLEVSGLYRSPTIKQKLEQCLCGVAGIRSAKANILTGRLLIVHAPGAPIDKILEIVEDQVGERQRKNIHVARTAVKPVSFAVSKVLDGFGSLLKGFAGYTPAPAFGAAAGGASAVPAGPASAARRA